MAEYTKQFLDKVAKAHRTHGFRVTRHYTKGKQYITFKGEVGLGNTRFSFTDHVRDIFPGAYVTSGLYSSDFFDLTYRINP
jgi:hypothetical protein